MQRVIRMICLELLGWPSNCNAQRTHCELIFVLDNTWAGTFVSHILLAPGICPHNYIRQVVQRVIRMRRLELFGWSSNRIAQRSHCELIFMCDSTWAVKFVSRILLAPGICPHNYVQ